MKTKTFDPVTFLGKNWSIESDNGFNPDDLSEITLKHYLEPDENYITSEESLKRIGDDKPLNADAFLRLWENKDLIPDDWTTYGDTGYIEFRGTILRRSDGDRYFLSLYRRDDGSWDWVYGWLDDDGDRSDVSPVLASASSSETKNSALNSLDLEDAIKMVKNAGYTVVKVV